MVALESSINAMTYISATGRAEAEASAQRWRDGAARGPLDGVPVTIKDNLAVAGMPATFGSPAYRSFVPVEDELRWRGFGKPARCARKTNLPEFALEGYTDNALFGVTGNPLDPTLTSGGSTGAARLLSRRSMRLSRSAPMEAGRCAGRPRIADSLR